MKHKDLAGKSISELVADFAKISVEQSDALRRDDTTAFNKLFDRLCLVVSELKARPGDQRRMLAQLYVHSSMQVRLNAAVHTLAAVPAESRQLLESIANSNWFPQAGYAGMTLSALERGTFVPE